MLYKRREYIVVNKEPDTLIHEVLNNSWIKDTYNFHIEDEFLELVPKGQFLGDSSHRARIIKSVETSGVTVEFYVITFVKVLVVLSIVLCPMLGVLQLIKFIELKNPEIVYLFSVFGTIYLPAVTWIRFNNESAKLEAFMEEMVVTGPY